MKRMYLIGIWLIACAFVQTLLAQHIIHGTVRDKADNDPLPGVIITILGDKGETVSYAVTNNNGEYSLKTKPTYQEYLFHTRLLGYQNYERKIENNPQRIDVALQQGEIELREVVVKSKPMWNRNDTIVYSVDAFKSEGDRSIGDLLKKLPGVEVSESGGIKYQGESINKFYIEGLDLLENRYGIATNNVPVDAVQNVEVLENHQPIRSLTDRVPSTKAAINLKLKKGALRRPVGNATMGGGYADAPLWLAELFALSAGSNKQSIVMYKGNNASKDITSEMTQQVMSVGDFQDVSSFRVRNWLSPSLMGNPPIERKRYLFNTSHVVSLNNLRSWSKDRQLRLNVQYLFDKRQQNASTISTHFLPNQKLVVEDINHNKHHDTKVDATLTFTQNDRTTYINNALSWSGDWSKMQASQLVNGMKVGQQFDLPLQLFKNNLNVIRRTDKRVWDFTSFTAYSSQPQRLMVEVDSLADSQRQDVDVSGFYSRNSSYYSWVRPNSSFTLKGVTQVSVDTYSSALQHQMIVDSTHVSAMSTSSLLELIPSYMYRVNGLTLTTDMPIQWQWLNLNRDLSNTSVNRSFLLVNPSLRLVYRFSPMLNATVGWRYSHSVGDYTDLLDVYYMSAYRSLSKRADLLQQTRRQSYSISFRYRNPLESFFANSSFVYAPSRRNNVSSQRFIGLDVINGLRPSETNMDLMSWMGYVGKYFSEIRTNTSLNVSWDTFRTQRLQQGVIYPLASVTWTVMPKVDVKVSDNCSVIYQLMASNRQNTISMSQKAVKSSLWQLTQQLSAFYLIGSRWQLNGRLEHSHNEISANNAVNAYFADATISYKAKSWECQLSANNLFNQSSYDYTTYVGLDTYSYSYGLRPRMLMLTLMHKF